MVQSKAKTQERKWWILQSWMWHLGLMMESSGPQRTWKIPLSSSASTHRSSLNSCSGSAPFLKHSHGPDNSEILALPLSSRLHLQFHAETTSLPSPLAWHALPGHSDLLKPLSKPPWASHSGTAHAWKTNTTWVKVPSSTPNCGCRPAPLDHS